MVQKTKIDSNAVRKDQREKAERLHQQNEQIEKLSVTPPRHLDKVAKRCWTQIVPSLNQTGIVNIQDKPLVESFCMAYSMLRKSWESVQENGATYMSDTGRVYKNPAVDILSDSQNKIKTLGTSIGMTPESRAQFVDLGKSDGSQDLDKILNKFG